MCRGIELAAGVSFDTCWFSDADVEGVAVQVAPLIAARAAGGEVLVSDGAGALLGQRSSCRRAATKHTSCASTRADAHGHASSTRAW